MGNNKLQQHIAEFLLERGYYTDVEQIDQIRCNKNDYDMRFYSMPKLDPAGDYVFEYHHTEKVVDTLTDDEIDKLIRLELIRELKSNAKGFDAHVQSLRADIGSTIGNDVNTIKGAVVFFAILTIINLVLSIIIVL